jgi:TIR domain
MRIVRYDATHIFICFSSKDEAVAREVVEFLEAKGLQCWISSRDVLPGQNYQETIVQAIEAARGIVFLFSESSSKSGEIKKELSIGSSINLPVFPVRLAPILPDGALRYELAIRQWIDIFPHRGRALGRLVETIKVAIDVGATHESEIPTVNIAASPGPSKSSSAKKRDRAATKPILAPGTQGFEAIRTLLARHIGPIAKVYVERAMTEARTADDFCERLAAHVAAPSDRTSFLRAVRTQLSVKS